MKIINMEIIESNKKCVENGGHYILQFKDQRSIVDKKDFLTAMSEAYDYAEKNSENKRYRICVNGEGERHNKHFHIHIILPKGDDELIRIIEKKPL